MTDSYSPAPPTTPHMVSLQQQKQTAAEAACSEGKGPFYSMGLETYRVPMALYEINRARLVQSMLKAPRKKKGGGGDSSDGDSSDARAVIQFH